MRSNAMTAAGMGDDRVRLLLADRFLLDEHANQLCADRLVERRTDGVRRVPLAVGQHGSRLGELVQASTRTGAIGDDHLGDFVDAEAFFGEAFFGEAFFGEAFFGEAFFGEAFLAGAFFG